MTTPHSKSCLLDNRERTVCSSARKWGILIPHSRISKHVTELPAVAVVVIGSVFVGYAVVVAFATTTITNLFDNVHT